MHTYLLVWTLALTYFDGVGSITTGSQVVETNKSCGELRAGLAKDLSRSIQNNTGRQYYLTVTTHCTELK